MEEIIMKKEIKVQLIAIAILVFVINMGNNVNAQNVHAENTMSNITKNETQKVTWKNFNRAETDKMFESWVDMVGIGNFLHVRKPTPVENQNVVRMNRDTQYSFVILDLTKPAELTTPETDSRFMSLQVINEDQYTKMVVYEPGTTTLTMENCGTRYVLAVIRTLVDANDPDDVKKVNALQDQIILKQESPGKFEIPVWDKESHNNIRNAYKILGETMVDTRGCFGDKDEVDPNKFLIGVAYGWGGNPTKDALYLGVTPDNNNGTTPYVLNVKDVPVDGFWSISLYNGKGYFEINKYDAYSINNITGKKNSDGSITIHFGGDPKNANFLPIVEGWNYLVRLYRPGQPILDGSWEFPKPVQASK